MMEIFKQKPVTEEKQLITFQLNASLKKDLFEIAKIKGMTSSGLIKYVLSEFVNKYHKENS